MSDDFRDDFLLECAVAELPKKLVALVTDSDFDTKAFAEKLSTGAARGAR